jgi:flagellar basal body-associated protein FliL
MAVPTPTAGSLARKAQAQVLGVLVLGLLAAAGLGYAGYQLHQLNSTLNQYTEAAAQHQGRMEALNLLYEMETSFARFLLDGNSANLGLMQRDRDSLEQLAQREPSRNDKVLQNLVSQEKRWYSERAQPLIEQRRNLPAGQGLSEDFLARYRTSGTGLELLDPQLISQTANGDAFRQLMESQRKLSVWLTVGYFAAAILVVLGVCVLAWGAVKAIAGLRRLPSS